LQETEKHPSIVWCKAYFDTLNRLGVTHECDRQTDRQTDSRTAYAVPRFTTLPWKKYSAENLQ